MEKYAWSLLSRKYQIAKQNTDYGSIFVLSTHPQQGLKNKTRYIPYTKYEEYLTLAAGIRENHSLTFAWPFSTFYIIGMYYSYNKKKTCLFLYH